MFQHTAARRRLATLSLGSQSSVIGFQHTAARRRLGPIGRFSFSLISFQHTAARRRLGEYDYYS